jgi:hypothetical protein
VSHQSVADHNDEHQGAPIQGARGHTGLNDSGTHHTGQDRTGPDNTGALRALPNRGEPDQTVKNRDPSHRQTGTHDPDAIEPNRNASHNDASNRDANLQDARNQDAARQDETHQDRTHQFLADGIGPDEDDLDELLNAWRSGASDKRRRREPTRTVSTNLKLTPPLWDVVDRLTEQRGTKKNRYIVGILERRLPVLLEQLDQDAFDLPAVPGQGRERRGISLSLPLSVADALNRIIADTGIVQHELLLRLVVPEVIRDWNEARRRGGR